MKKIYHFVLSSICSALLVVQTMSLGACAKYPNQTANPNMTILSSRLQELFEKTKTVCFGHFVVTVPATAKVVYGRAEVEFPIFFLEGKRGEMDERIKSLIDKAEADRRLIGKDKAGNFTMYGRVIDGVMPGQKLAFSSRDYATTFITSYIPIGKDLYIQELNGSLSSAQDTNIAILNKVARNLRLRAQDEIPSEAGMCIDGGFVALKSPYENARIGIRFQEFPDLHFSIETRRNQDQLVESNDLKYLLDKTEQDSLTNIGNWRTRIQFLRRGPRQVGQWHGYEVLARMPQRDTSTESHEFRFTSLGSVNDSIHPQLDLRFDTGVEGNTKSGTHPSISDEEAVALWDKIAASIRVRPVGATLTEAPKIPLGERAVTGRTCLQTGWWECEEEADVVGERRRLFKAGTKMPKVTLFGKPGIWQKLHGERPMYEQVTMWQLVDYAADEPVPPASDTEPPARG